MNTILFITPHTSTGGLPQFLLKKIQVLLKKYNVYLVEWADITGNILITHRNQFKDLLGSNFISLSDNKSEIFGIIDKIKPDFIHFEEFPETFINYDIIDKIYESDKYKIIETTHGTGFKIGDKYKSPDKLMLVSDFNYQQFFNITNTDVLKYPSTPNNRNLILKNLGLNPNYYMY